MESYLPKGKKVVIDGGAHHINMDHRVGFNHLVIDFLKQIHKSV
jgi:pimeloyl-ACP methyl ester carboxylesterase